MINRNIINYNYFVSKKTDRIIIIFKFLIFIVILKIVDFRKINIVKLYTMDIGLIFIVILYGNEIRLIFIVIL